MDPAVPLSAPSEAMLSPPDSDAHVVRYEASRPRLPPWLASSRECSLSEAGTTESPGHAIDAGLLRLCYQAARDIVEEALTYICDVGCAPLAF